MSNFAMQWVRIINLVVVNSIFKKKRRTVTSSSRTKKEKKWPNPPSKTQEGDQETKEKN